MSSEIHVFRPFFRVEECLAELRLCLEKGWTGVGWKTEEFEEAWKTYTGLPNAHFVSSGTAALHLAVRVLKDAFGWQEGDEVVTTPLTFSSTNQVLLHERMTPVFADVDEYLCLDPEAVRAAITPRTRAVMFVGLGGQTGRLHEVSDICHVLGIPLILDAAHLAGARVRGKHAGVEDAFVSSFSFHPVKNLPTGDSGMVCFQDPKLDRAARVLSWHGIDKNTWERTHEPARAYRWRYAVEELGFKYNGNSVMAALGLVGLRYLDGDNEYRRGLARRYEECLDALAPEIELIPAPADVTPSGHMFRVLADRRDELVAWLNTQAVFPGVHYDLSTFQKPFARYLKRLPRAERAAARLVTLPCHLGMGAAEADRVVDRLLDFYPGRNKKGDP